MKTFIKKIAKLKPVMLMLLGFFIMQFGTVLLCIPSDWENKGYVVGQLYIKFMSRNSHYILGGEILGIGLIIFTIGHVFFIKKFKIGGEQSFYLRFQWGILAIILIASSTIAFIQISNISQGNLTDILMIPVSGIVASSISSVALIFQHKKNRIFNIISLIVGSFFALSIIMAFL